MSKSHSASRLRSIVFAIACASLMLSACNDGQSSPKLAASSDSESPDTEAAPASKPITTPAVHAEGERAPRNPNERPLPSFSGITIAGTKLAIRDLLGSRIVLFFFNPEVDPAPAIGDAVNTVFEQAGDHNFQVIGVGVGSSSSTLSRFAKDRSLGFPIIDDSSGTITRLLRLQSPNAIIGIDAEGYVGFGMASFPTDGDVTASVETELRHNLRLPDIDTSSPGSLYAFPKAPELGVVEMSTGDVLETEDLAGHAAIVIFFLHTCPHCHHALASIKTTLESIPSEQRPRLVAISLQNAPGAIREAMKELGLDYFDPYLDPGKKATERWGVTGGVPVVTILDKQGRIRHRSVGWNDNRDPGIVKMKAAMAAEARVPMLLDPKGYSGNDVCGVCHEQEYATWQYTAHSTAFDTLVAHTANRRTDCIGCHVVGFDEPGGYDFRAQPQYLENVGCESCHGRGGPHLSPTFVPKKASGDHDYEQVCATCHNPKHSLGFEFANFHPRISHKEIAGLTDAERADLLGGSGPSRDLLPTSADYVGSEACQSCHTAEFETWQADPHAHAVATLEKDGKAGDVQCLECHTTAFGKTGGFPSSAVASDHPDLARVGCESCHGPGGNHIGENVKRVGTILSLGDKCDSCVILKVCGTCHDDANDPGFQFKVEERIEAQRHGTIEAAATLEDESADRARLHEAFGRLAERDVDRTSHFAHDDAHDDALLDAS
jgi:peroxiredoxin